MARTDERIAFDLKDLYRLPHHLSLKELLMSATDYMLYRAKISHYKSNYERDQDDSRYTSSCVVAALSLLLADNKESLKRMGKAGVALPAVLSASSPVFMAAIDSVADAMHCPVDQRMTAVDFLSHFAKQVGNRCDSEYVEPVRKALKSVGDGLRTLGFTS
jgi:hypothetical protein